MEGWAQTGGSGGESSTTAGERKVVVASQFTAVL